MNLARCGAAGVLSHRNNAEGISVPKSNRPQWPDNSVRRPATHTRLHVAIMIRSRSSRSGGVAVAEPGAARADADQVETYRFYGHFQGESGALPEKEEVAEMKARDPKAPARNDDRGRQA